MHRLRPYLTVRDIPLWLAATGLALLTVTGAAQSLADHSLMPVFVLVVGLALVVTAGGRSLVRRMAYRRLVRIVIALLALALVFFLPGALATVMLPSALALLAVEMMAPPPPAALPAGGPPATAPSRENARPHASDSMDEGREFDWPDDQEPAL
ncbi:MAG: hypothetical protein ACLQBX_19825 [Candidatus Limnocylindrales bacterium]|jgi:hypothetical protein